MSNLTAVVPPGAGSGHGECFAWRPIPKRDAETVVVDAGRYPAVGARAGNFEPEILILSHDDQDHIGGAVSLISTANRSLKELWVPVEWIILINRIANTEPGEIASPSNDFISISDLEEILAEQIVSTLDSPQSIFGEDLLSSALENVNNWGFNDYQRPGIFEQFESYIQSLSWYGDKSIDQIVQRVKKSSKRLIEIFETAREQSIKIRFFSIDLAIFQSRKTWETEGRPGTATIANAAEVHSWSAVRLPSGVLNTIVFSYLMIQNRRALCTVLWEDVKTPEGGAFIWSDTDGNWLDSSSPLGLNKVIAKLGVSSAPHHASSNPAHDRVWVELAHSPTALVMISAGGQYNQGYRPEYNRMGQKRCCTWCRPDSRSSVYQEVTASSDSSGIWKLLNQCQGHHS